MVIFFHCHVSLLEGKFSFIRTEGATRNRDELDLLNHPYQQGTIENTYRLIGSHGGCTHQLGFTRIGNCQETEPGLFWKIILISIYSEN